MAAHNSCTCCCAYLPPPLPEICLHCNASSWRRRKRTFGLPLASSKLGQVATCHSYFFRSGSSSPQPFSGFGSTDIPSELALFQTTLSRIYGTRLYNRPRVPVVSYTRLFLFKGWDSHPIRRVLGVDIILASVLESQTQWLHWDFSYSAFSLVLSESLAPMPICLPFAGFLSVANCCFCNRRLEYECTTRTYLLVPCIT